MDTYGWLPWYAGGDPWFTDDEIDALLADLKRRADRARKQARRTRGPQGSRSRRGRR